MPDNAPSHAIKTISAPHKALIKEGSLVRVSSGIYTKVRAGAKDAPLAKTQSNPLKPISLPEDLNALPLKNVSVFVKRFAMSRDVQFKRTGLDPWAEAVTRASGADVTLDETGKFLQAKSVVLDQVVGRRCMAWARCRHWVAASRGWSCPRSEATLRKAPCSSSPMSTKQYQPEVVKKSLGRPHVLSCIRVLSRLGSDDTEDVLERGEKKFFKNQFK